MSRKADQVVATSLLLLYCGLGHTQDLPHVARPVLKVGDTWTYTTVDPYSKSAQWAAESSVSKVSDTEIVMTDQAGDITTVLNQDFAITRSGRDSFDPPIQALKFPMSVGARWEHSNSRNHAQCGRNLTRLKSEVVRWEDITVGAGTFRTLHIKSEGEWSNSCGSGRLAYRFWYSPDVKWWVKTESNVYARGSLYESTTRELKSYRLVKVE